MYISTMLLLSIYSILTVPGVNYVRWGNSSCPDFTEPVVSTKAELLRDISVTLVEHLTLSASSQRASIIQLQLPTILAGLTCMGQSTK